MPGNRVLSVEPYLNLIVIPLEQLKQIDAVICGGESGKNARPMHPDWVRSLRDQCAAAGVPFFFKQWGEYKNGSDHTGRDYIVTNGGFYTPWTSELKIPEQSQPCVMALVGKKKAGRILDGRTHDDLSWHK